MPKGARSGIPPPSLSNPHWTARGREILGRLGALGDLPERAVHAQATNVYVGQQRLMQFVRSAFSNDEAHDTFLHSC
jgi:hypothetical protein